jgi:Fe2+ transport system protein FeoA
LTYSQFRATIAQELKMNFNLSSAQPAPNRDSQARKAGAPSLTLADLAEGQTAVLNSLSLPGTTSEHLMWLGFVPGAEITAGKTGPGGDPRVYTVCGSAFALRRATASCMLVSPPEDDGGAQA